jgi:DNA-binding NarL/FixJ family response regulator
MGAASWAALVVHDLERVAPGRAEGELTSTEQRVAALVAEGMRNKEIAGAMYVSIATVEAHLTRIYRKLGIRSRNELVRMMVDGDLELTQGARSQER